MSRLNFQAQVAYMAHGLIGKRPAGNVAVRIFAKPGNGRKTKPLWHGITDRQGRFHAEINTARDLAGMTPQTARLLERRGAKTGYVAEFEKAGERARLPIEAGRNKQDFVLPFAPSDGLVIEFKPVKKANPALPKLGKKELQTLLDHSGARIQSPTSGKKVGKRIKDTEAQDLKRFKQVFPKRKRLLKDLERQAKGRDVSVGAKIKTKGGAKAVQLLHPQTLVRDMVMMQAEITDIVFQRRQHCELYEIAESGLKQLEGQVKDKAIEAFRNLDAPIAVANATFDDVMAEVTGVAVFIRTWLDIFRRPGSGAPATCGGEEGSGFGGDATDPSVVITANPVGLMANNTWPLKPFTTCVRDQGQRGTCTAFGITAAAECLIAADFGRWMNLSEQDLYMHQKLKWFPIPMDWYGDGYNAVYSTILQSLGRTYVFPYERDWDYNKSANRQEDDDERAYTLSCVGYNGEACSDTNHQAELIECYSTDLTTVETVTREVCSWVETAVDNIPLIGGFLADITRELVCETITDIVEFIEHIEVCIYDTDTPPSSGFQILNATPLWVPMPWSNPNWSTAKALLTLKRPIVFCFEVSESFDNQSGGFVTYSGSGEDSRGGHCALITGFVDNGDLPTGAPAGAGGGYFVVKNSWGADWGDQGFCYVPYDWVAEYGTAMITVNAVSP